MPYIPDHELRSKFKRLLDDVLILAASSGSLRGNLNYCITYLIHLFIHRYYCTDHNGKTKIGFCYDAVNDAAGILDSVKGELKNAVINPYEDKKRRDNGPVSDLDDDSHERMR